jgi:hypothetical protein
VIIEHAQMTKRRGTKESTCYFRAHAQSAKLDTRTHGQMDRRTSAERSNVGLAPNYQQGSRPTTDHRGWLRCGAGVVDHRHRGRRRRGGEVELLWQEGVVHVTYGDPAHGGQGNTTVGVLFNIPRLPYKCRS